MNRHPIPTRWADRLLETFCKPCLLEEFQGDLHELYGERCKAYETSRARLLYVYQALKFFKPFALEKIQFHPLPYG